MSKRTKLILVLLIGLLLLGIGLYFLIQPILQERKAAQQPPALPESAAPFIQSGATNEVPRPNAEVTPLPPQVTPSETKTRTLENRARATLERIGSGVASDGFLGYVDVSADFTSDGRTWLLAEQNALQKAHPPTGPAYGISTRAASAKTLSGSIGDEAIKISVQTVQTVDNGDPTHPVETKQISATITFKKQADGSYLIDKVVFTPSTP